LFQLCNLNVQMAREIQDHITGIEALLNGDAIERGAIRSHWRMIRALVAQEESNAGRCVQRLRAEVAKNKDQHVTLTAPELATVF